DGPATRHRVAIDSRNQWLPGLFKQCQAFGPHAIDGAGLDAGGIVGGPLLEVTSGAESTPGTGDDGHARRIIAIEASDRLVQLSLELAVDRIEGLWSIQGHGDDQIFLVIQHSSSHIVPRTR